MIKYGISFFYTLHSRIKTSGKRIAYLFTFIFPVLLFALTSTYTTKESLINVLIGTIIALIGTMSVYEVGYIKNDVFTTKKEKNPTLRLSVKEMKYIENNINNILVLKYGLAILTFIPLFFMGFNVFKYFIALALIELVYFMHNSVRGRVSILSFFILSTLRYIAPLVMLNFDMGTIILVFVLVISIPRTIEKAAEKKFKFSFLSFIDSSIDINLLRFIYYIALIIIVFAQELTLSTSKIYMVLTIYYLLYRGAIFACVFLKGRISGVD